MELTPAKFLTLFLFLSVTGWLFFLFAARLTAWMISRMIGASVQFRFGGFNCLKDVSVNFKKGVLESLVIGEVRIRTCKSSSDSLGSELAGAALLQVLLYDVEVVIRKPAKRNTTKKHHPRSHLSGHGKWMLFAKITKYVTVSILELVMQVPDWTVEIKELDLRMDTEESGTSLLSTRLLLSSCSLYDKDRNSHAEYTPSLGERVLIDGNLENVMGGTTTPFYVEQISINSTFGHIREQGVTVRHVDVLSGDMVLNINEKLVERLKAPRSRSDAKVSGSGLRIGEGGQATEVGLGNRTHILSKAPEKASLNLPKLLIKCGHKGGKIQFENEISGVQFVCCKVQQIDELGGSLSHLDIHLESGEIHVMRDDNVSFLGITRTAVIASVEIPKQNDMLPQVEVDVKLGGAQCSLLTGKVDKCLDMLYSMKPKAKGNDPVHSQKPPSSTKGINWTCTVSAPDMSITVHDISGLVLYNVSLQTSHIFFNSASKHDIGIHTELGELYVYMIEENSSLYKGLFGMDTNSGCLMQMTRVTIDFGVIECEASQVSSTCKKKAVVTVEFSGTAVHLTQQRFQSLLKNSLGLVHQVKQVLTKGRGARLSKGSSAQTVKKRRIQEVKLNIEGLSVQYCAEMHIVDSTVPDPKKVNFGCEGGEVILEENNDGKPRVASIKPAIYRGYEGSHVVCKLTFDIARLQLQIGYVKNDFQVNVRRLKLLHQEFATDLKPLCETLILDSQSAKVIYRLGTVGNGAPGCLVCISDLKGRWEPDFHLFILDSFLHMKAYFQRQRQIHHVARTVRKSSISIQHDASESVESKSSNKKAGKAISVVIAVDFEHIDICAALADGVDASFSVSSMFSEDFNVGILLEHLKILLNGATVMKSERLQVARIPCFIKNSSDISLIEGFSKGKTAIANCWDYLIQGSGLYIVLPYRLECRAIDDAVEDTWRALKLAMLAQRMSRGSSATATRSQRKVGEISSSFGGIKFIFESVTAEIEEEPLQGWLDEHHRLLLKQKIELDLREHLLEESTFDESTPEKGQVDISELRLKLQHQAFQAYNASCKKLKSYESSGSIRSKFQLGFRPSVNRGSLFSIKASHLEVTLLDIEGGKSGMIEQIRKLDCVPLGAEIPYSRILGKRVKICTSSLIVQLRDYTLPMFCGEGGKCDGQLIFARQATCFPRQIHQELYVGRWRKVSMFRSESGTTPPFKMFSELPIEFKKAEVAFGVGFEPALGDVSYAFTVALRRADLTVHDLPEVLEDVDFYGFRSTVRPSSLSSIKKERNLPWWDDMRYYIHGRNSIFSVDFKLLLLATTNPYEDSNFMKIEAGFMDIQQQEGSLSFFASNFRLGTSSMECLMIHEAAKPTPESKYEGSIQSPFFKLDITMDWDCETGNPLFHYLHAFPHENITREKVFDPFRSTSLILRWNFRLADVTTMENSVSFSDDSGYTSQRFERLKLNMCPVQNTADSCGLHGKTELVPDVPTMSLGGHDLLWIFKWWNTLYSPPHKLRTFSKWPRFAVARVPRSGNLSLDKVLTDFMLRVDSTPAKIKHIPLVQDDPAEGLTFSMKKFKYELCYSRGNQRYTFDCKRDILELVYQGLDLHVLKADLRKEVDPLNDMKFTNQIQKPTEDPAKRTNSTQCWTENGFFFTTDYFSLRKQAPKADLSRLSLWQEEAHRPSNTKAMECNNVSGSDPAQSDPSDDDGFNTVMPDNCLHVSLYGLKLLWAIYTRDAVWAWVQNLNAAFETPKPSPSRQYAQRKIMEEHKLSMSNPAENEVDPSQSNKVAGCSPSPFPSPSRQDIPLFHPSPVTKAAVATSNDEQDEEAEEEGTMHFMVNVVQPQFNLQAEEARGRFLLAAASGKVMARSFRSIINVGPEMISQNLRSGVDHLSGSIPEVAWSRRELSVLLEQVQAHVAPTDVDPGAGLQWLPRVSRNSHKVKRTGALLERVFMPCAMYFQYTRCKSEGSDIKVKALKRLSFNSSNITAIMTSRQFQVMVDIISNLLLARLPKPRRYFFLHGCDEDDDIKETDEVVPDGVQEVELARIKLEETERELKLLATDLKSVRQECSTMIIDNLDDEKQQQQLWMLDCGKGRLIAKLDEEWLAKVKARKLAARSLRIAMQVAAQQRFKEKEKSKSIPSAMQISWAIDKIVWRMLFGGESFAEAEINNMNLNVDRDFHERGIAQFTTKHFVVKNCLPNPKSNTVLSAWNPPLDWGRNSMLRVDAKQGAPKEGNSPLELFQVQIYPLKINLTERMYRMMWEYFFPKEDHDTQRRQVWKASTTAVVKRGKRTTGAVNESSISSVHRREQVLSKTSNTVPSALPMIIQPHLKGEEWQGIDIRLAAQVLEKDMRMASLQNAKFSGLQRSSSVGGTKEDKIHDLMIDSMQSTDGSLALSSSRNLHCSQSEHIEAGQASSLATMLSDNGLQKLRDGPRANRSQKLSRDDKKLIKSTSQDEKKSSASSRTNLELHNIRISQVELLITYEGSRMSVNELRLLMDTFMRVEFRGTWRRFFSRVKKHIIWSVLKSVAGMQGKKFKDKLQSQAQIDGGGYPGDMSSSSDSDESNADVYEQFFFSKLKTPADRAGEGFVSSIRGLFNSQRKKAKAVVLRRKRADDEAGEEGWTEGEADTAPITRQYSISKAKRLLRRHTTFTKKLLSSARHRGITINSERGII
ncbi:hypothetical protein KP509_30G061600 [Ceratopteris richardii]|uniref:FMP27/BLTP2/Hobbit GFWDK motif-containing RBG unit domain-containing protein n=1 Tax=Ceratopteris richardii TaxID=49495 RepID=A0A8T2R404_CERRI|nr:hypothetical protein KP509_30G061600 [Ceratopteris richardii]